jgi:hypothetical protein
MAWFDTFDDDRLARCEEKATEIRKILLGVLLLAKDLWKDAMEHQTAGNDVLRAVEKVEEDFVNLAVTDRLERIEDLLDVILTRAKAIFLLMEYISPKRET